MVGTKKRMRGLFWKTGGLFIGLALLAGVARAEEANPNILFVMVDDLAPDAIFEGRFPFLNTPNIDRLEKEGAVLEKMFVATSLCSPSRATMLTGTYAHVHGVRGNETNDPDPSLPQFPQILQKAGYKTALIGKWHMDPRADPRPGFDYWLSFKGQGVYTDPELNENGNEYRAKGYITEILTKKTMDFLNRNLEDPFCILLWHKANHAPFTPAPQDKNACPEAFIPEPESWSLDLSGVPLWMRRTQIYGPHYANWVASEGQPVPDRLEPKPWNPRRKISLDMLRCMLDVDRGLGQVMGLLEEQGRLDNTVVVFTADNGWFFGEHRSGDKRLAYEESMRIPFAIRYPSLAKPGSRIEGMTASIDIAPTLLHLAGADIPETMQGESFVPILEGRTSGRTAPFFYEYFQEKYAPGIPTILAIRTPEWKYIHLPYESAEEGNFDELYHLKKDPHELRNLIHSPEATQQLQLMRRFLREAVEQYGYTDPSYRYVSPKKGNGEKERGRNDG